MKKILLDTNAYSDLLRGDQYIYEVVTSANEINISVIVIAELLAGFKGGSREKSNEDLLNKFLQQPTVNVLNISITTSYLFAEIKQSLKQRGKPIPINDLWIASQSVEFSASLVTRDKHFKEIDTLSLIFYQ